MTYDQQEWQSGKAGGTIISAESLNHMEAGIGSAHQEIDGRLAEESLTRLVEDTGAEVFASVGDLSSTKRRLPVPVAIKANPPADASNNKSNGSHTGGTAKYNHLFTRSAYGIQLVFSNWVAGTSNTEMDAWNDIVVGAAVELNGTVMPVTFGGKRRTTISPGGTVVSDPIGIDVPKGATMSTRTFVEVGAGQFFPLGNIPQQSSGEGNNYATPTGADLTSTGSASLTGVATGGPYAFGPSAILAQVIDPDKPVVGIVGDSIANGTGEVSAAQGGFIQRSLGNNYSFQKVAYPGEALLSGWAAPNGLNRRRRVALMALCGVTHIITDYTVNSLGTTTLQVDAAAVWVSLARVATQGVYATTLTPQTTSSNGWTTAAGQAVADATKEGRRLAFNAWLRDGAPLSAAFAPVAPGTITAGTRRAGEPGHPLAGYFDAADLAETARDSGIWKPNYTADGTHPNATGHAALALAIDPLLFGKPSV